jgi:hypothetical protein
VYVHENDIVRVFYDKSGTHAVNLSDTNANTIPDIVEDVAKQSWAAYRLFTDTLNFRSPLQSERYDQATYIDVNLLSASILEGNTGIAYELDFPLRFSARNDSRDIRFDYPSC